MAKKFAVSVCGRDAVPVHFKTHCFVGLCAGWFGFDEMHCHFCLGRHHGHDKRVGDVAQQFLLAGILSEIDDLGKRSHGCGSAVVGEAFVDADFVEYGQLLGVRHAPVDVFMPNMLHARSYATCSGIAVEHTGGHSEFELFVQCVDQLVLALKISKKRAFGDTGGGADGRGGRRDAAALNMVSLLALLFGRATFFLV